MAALLLARLELEVAALPPSSPPLFLLPVGVNALATSLSENLGFARIDPAASVTFLLDGLRIARSFLMRSASLWPGIIVEGAEGQSRAEVETSNASIKARKVNQAPMQRIRTSLVLLLKVGANDRDGHCKDEDA